MTSASICARVKVISASDSDDIPREPLADIRTNQRRGNPLDVDEAVVSAAEILRETIEIVPTNRPRRHDERWPPR